MKKIVIALLVLCCLVLICIYAFIPGRIEFEKVIRIKVNQSNASRFLADESKWRKWWPKGDNRIEQADTINSNIDYVYKNYHYVINRNIMPVDSIVIKKNSIRINSLLNMIALSVDSVAIQWAGQSTTESNPVKRLQNYLQRKKVVKNVEELLQSMKVFLENEKNIYGIHIEQVKVKDTLLVATRYSSNSYPTTYEIYNLIKSLKDYILEKGATETNYPMLHIREDSAGFNTMVAIPVSKLIPTNNNFILKRMVPGKILVTEVKGGRYTTDEALKQLEIYLDDNHLRSPAIPFESLVTDRSKEPDTSKWITKIYYPIY